jgi:hypothetical protein
MNYEISKDRSRLTFRVNAGEQKELRELPDIQTNQAMYDWFESIIANSDLIGIDPSDTGDLTSAPMLGLVKHYENGAERILERWAFMDYQLRSPLEDLRDKGICVFVGGKL